MENKETLPISDPELDIIKLEKDSALAFKERRLQDWDDNYTLYRDKVVTNRLTQRQSVNVPLMKYGLNSILKDVDDPPQLYFQNLDNEDQKEIFYNEHWKEVAKRNKLVMVASVDRKQAFLFGRTFKKINIENGKVTFEVIDPKDMLVHRFVNPVDLHSAKCLIQTGIYRTLTEILEDEEYNKEVRAELRTYYENRDPELEGDDTYAQASEKADRMTTMGVDDEFDPVLGETYLELNEVYRFEWDDVAEDTIIFRYVIAIADDQTFKLHKQALHEIFGKTKDNFWFNHFPYSSWGTDPERTDFWNDGAGDILRTPNKIANSWISSLVENRQLRNYGMTYYDSTDPTFVPQTFQPIPYGFYPVPGDPNKVMKPVEIPDLSESLDEIQYIISLAEKATASTSTQSGAIEQKQVTLGEIQLALANAQDRVKSIQQFIDEDWKEFGMLYIKLLEGAGQYLDPVTVNKKGRLGKKMYTREISMKDWKTKSGYTVEVRMLQDKQAEDVDMIQKLTVARNSMPDNVPLKEIYDHHILQFAGLTPDEISTVEEFERQAVVDEPVAEEEMAIADEAQASEGQGIPTVPDIGAVAQGQPTV